MLTQRIKIDGHEFIIRTKDKVNAVLCNKEAQVEVKADKETEADL